MQGLCQFCSPLASIVPTRTIFSDLLLYPTIPMSYIVASKVKELLKGMGLMMAGDFPDFLSKEVEAVIKRAGKRAESNGRRTARGTDL